MKQILFLMVCIISFSACKKTEPQPICYACIFGTIIVNGQSFKPAPEVHCEQGAENYKKYHSNGWQFPTSCKPVR